LFPLAASHALDHPGAENPPLRTLKAFCWQHFQALGFDCMADAFAAVVPRTCGRLSLDAWSTSELTVAPWTFRIECRVFWLGSNQVHFALHHDGPLPGVTETGYRSIFVPLSNFAGGLTPADFIRSMFPRIAQLSLF
jgi:hypothetical protein